MKEELIDLYRNVQGRRGEWKVGDQYICLSDGHVGRVQNYAQCVWMEHSADRYLYLPPVYSDDGRCLWDWADWERWEISVNTHGCPMMYAPGEGECIHADTLPEALLRAIAEQEGEG